MKTKHIFPAFLVFFILTLGACGAGSTQNNHEAVNAHGDSDAHTSTYVCPMHCVGSGASSAGICPTCGMEYELLSEHTSNGHLH